MIYNRERVTDVSLYKTPLSQIESPNRINPAYVFYLKNSSYFNLEEVITNCGLLLFSGSQYFTSKYTRDLVRCAVEAANLGGYSGLLTTVMRRDGRDDMVIKELKACGFVKLPCSTIINKRTNNKIFTMLLNIDKYKE